jgi:hypothetical protein
VSPYRTLKRSPINDVHHVAEHVVGPGGFEQQTNPNSPSEDWTGRRKAKPTDILLPRTVRWIATLPLEFQPTATAETFPRIANALAALWSAPEELTNYLTELVVDKRGRRRGFPMRVLSELDALRAYYATFLIAEATPTSRRSTG